MLQALRRRYSAALQVNSKDLIAAVEQGWRELAERAAMLNLPVANGSALSTIRLWTGGGPGGVEANAPGAEDTVIRDALRLDAMDNAADPQQVLSAGIRDVTETLTTDFALQDVLQMVLATMYRGMGFTRTPRTSCNAFPHGIVKR